MRIGYITKEDPSDIRAYSGTHYSMHQALKNEFEEVIPLGPVDHWYKNIAKLKGKIKTFSNEKVFKFQYDIELAKKHAEMLDSKIEQAKPDVLIGSLVSPEVAFLKTEIPLYLTTDATFPLLQDSYSSHSNLYPESIKNAMILERQAFIKAKKLLLPLEWLAESARNHYRVPDSKIEVIPYGRNLLAKEEDIEELVQVRLKNDEITLLFVGVRWEEKGGPKAVKVVQSLIERGLKARLQVAGCSPSCKEDFVDVLGFLDKQNPQDLSKLIDLYKKASFFILPTNAECIGMSFIEAASFGLPAIGTNVGGVAEAVIDTKTGLIFDVGQNPNEIAESIKNTWQNHTKYTEMSVSAYKHYSENMNWKNWGEKVKQAIAEK